MAPDDIEKFLHNVDRGRRDFLRKIIAGAAFAPPLMASFSLEGPAITAAEAGTSNQCSNQTPTTLFFDFSGTEYQDNFRGILRAADINPGTSLGGGSQPSLNFTGGANAAGSTWLTVLDDESPIFGEECGLTLSADVLFNKYNNTKGAALLALYNEGPGRKGLALFVFDAGNTDVLQLCTVDQAGKLVALKTVSLGAGIGENVWYRLTMVVSDPGTGVTVTGTVFRHTTPTNPNSPVGTQVGGTLSFSGPLPTGVDPEGEVGLVARAVSALVDLSVTNFTVTGFPPIETC